MTTNVAAHPWRTALAWSAVWRTAGLALVGFIGWLRCSAADAPAWRAVSLVEILVLAALVGAAWYLFRAHAEGRWRAALDRYIEREEAKIIHSRRKPHARPQSKVW
jgi:hypothetical protein